MFVFFFPIFLLLLRILLSAIRATISATAFIRKEEKKMRKNQVFLHPVFIEDLLFLYNDIIV